MSSLKDYLPSVEKIAMEQLEKLNQELQAIETQLFLGRISLTERDRHRALIENQISNLKVDQKRRMLQRFDAAHKQNSSFISLSKEKKTSVVNYLAQSGPTIRQDYTEDEDEIQTQSGIECVHAKDLIVETTDGEKTVCNNCLAHLQRRNAVLRTNKRRRVAND